jgi:hypothetical protein
MPLPYSRLPPVVRLYPYSLGQSFTILQATRFPRGWTQLLTFLQDRATGTEKFTISLYPTSGNLEHSRYFSLPSTRVPCYYACVGHCSTTPQPDRMVEEEQANGRG